MKTVAEIGKIIEDLTKDEDTKQELWLQYMICNQIDISSHHLNIDDDQDPVLRQAMWRLIKQPPSENLMNVLENLSNFERKIAFMLMLGISTKKIAIYIGASEVRIKQAISTIRYNKSWIRYYGTEIDTYKIPQP